MKKKLVILSGAGISAESGISTFRDQGGLWEQYSIEEVCTPEGWAANPALVQEFYNQRRLGLLTAQPNAAHLGVAALEKDFDVTVITQNVDNLHERAGSTHIVHLHGELTKVRSVKNENRIYELSPDHYEIGVDETDEYGDRLRPHIVWFGEAVPMMELAMQYTEEADIFVVIGTSLNVYPAAGLVYYVRPEVPIYLIDPNEVNIKTNHSVHIIRQGASQGVAKLIELLKAQV